MALRYFLICLIGIFSIGSWLSIPGNTAMAKRMTDDELRAAASKEFKEGNFRDALEKYLKLARVEQAAGTTLADDFQLVYQCLAQLQRIHEFDAILEEVVALHPQEFHLIRTAGNTLLNTEHWGFTVAGKFERGSQRGGGEWTFAAVRDRVRSIQLLVQAMKLIPEGLDPLETGRVYMELANAVRYQGNSGEDWRLQSLTDLTSLPDYEVGVEPWMWRGGGRGFDAGKGAPIDEAGQPVYYAVPKSWELAANDGERWRWLLEQTALADPNQAAQTQWIFAEFLQSQFGVQTLAQWGTFFGDGGDDSAKPDATANPFALPTLTEDETIARLATGVKRFKLPDEFKPIRIWQKLADGQSAYAAMALDRLASVFTDRQQYTKAADYWRQGIKRFGSEHRQAALDQIVKPWGRFENTSTQPAGQGATVDFRFRNGKQVAFTAQKVKIEQLLKDVKEYINRKPAEFDWQHIQIDTIGYDLLQENRAKYLGEQVAQWSMELDPKSNHFDRRITVTTPLQQAGAYLITAKMQDGNISHVVIWIDDLAILRKTTKNGSLYFVGDAVSGKSVGQTNLEFFGWRMEWDNDGKKQRLITSNFAEKTDKEGMIVVDPKLLDQNFQWLTIARDPKGRMAFLGFHGVWLPHYAWETFHQLKIYGITDRPVYRPDQKVEFKFWLGDASYATRDRENSYARQDVVIQINDPQGNQLYQQVMKTDDYGGVSGNFTLSGNAALGQYSIMLNDAERKRFGSQISFRVEEYKKPEFEVTVEAPEKPVMLGETVEAKIIAKYYFGGAVAEGIVRFKVHRTAKEQRWFPARRWDWLYGPGYWWFSPDAGWYPGFSRWGCYGPLPPWWGGSQDPPELVMDEEVPLGADGTVSVKIDTALAKAVHGDQDHQYEITAEVVDASRRTIVGTGSVIAARQAFRVFCWADRGYVRVNDSFIAYFNARTADGRGVAGKGTLKLLKVTYDAQGKPSENEVQSWDVDTDESGNAQQLIKASEAGQYRLSYRVNDGQGHEFEGGQLITFTGAGFNGEQFRFNDLELIADKAEYKPGDKVQLMINTNRPGSTVLLWLRPAGNTYAGRPIVLTIPGKSTVYEFDVEEADAPNFFVEATTIANAKFHQVAKEMVVPPVQRVLNVKVEPAQSTYLPGAPAQVKLTLTDIDGKPFVGSAVMTMYDRAVEYISGGSNVPEIREFFWKWRRSHHPQSLVSLGRAFGNLVKPNDPWMQNLGVFGDQTTESDPAALEEASNMAPGGGGGFGGGRREMRQRGGMVAESLAAPMAAADAAGGEMAKQSAGLDQEGAGAVVTPAVRTNFADSAFWKADIVTDGDGTATIDMTMPENLTAWKIRTWALGTGTRVGEATTEVVTAKNIMVRLQAPRFFVEKDEVVLSAIVHNYLAEAKMAKVVLDLSGDLMEVLGERETTVNIPAGGETRVDWRVKVLREGEAAITMSALTDVESDAMQMKFPVFVHGMLKTESYSSVVRADQPSTTIDFNVPVERRVEQSVLEVRFSPTLAGAMVDALPYLVEYPYGCTEQTLNRFLPTVITQNILQRMNLDLAAIQENRTNLNAQELGDPTIRRDRWKVYARNPVFDPEEVERMVKQGVKDLTSMQCSDGGWGWFSGIQEHSWPHTTAVVVQGLQVAVANDVALVPGVLEKGIAWLQNYQNQQVVLLQEWVRLQDIPRDKWPKDPRYKTIADNLDAMVYRILVDAQIESQEMQDFLYRDRTHLSLYGMGLFGLALDKVQQVERRDMVIRNIDQFVTVDDENQTAFIDLPNRGNYWWYWYGDQIEANAIYLKLLSRVNAQDPKAAGLVKYLLNNRRHGTYWYNTRDTAICIEALADYLVRSGEDQPEMTVELWLDGELKRSIEITPQVLFQFDNTLTLVGDQLTAGAHKLEIKRRGKGPVYANAYVTNFTLEDNITAAGLEIKVNRKFYKLVQREGAQAEVQGAHGQVVTQDVEKYDRVALENWSQVTSGDLIEIELEIDSKNDYEYIVFEDMKAAGCEPVNVQSGYIPSGLGAYVEFRDERVAFFMRQLSRGKHSVSYRLRAEIPGRFSALPTRASAMYAPELKANSDEMKIEVLDRTDVGNK